MKKLLAGAVIFVLLMSFGTAVFADLDNGYIIGRLSVELNK